MLCLGRSGLNLNLDLTAQGCAGGALLGLPPQDRLLATA